MRARFWAVIGGVLVISVCCISGVFFYRSDDIGPASPRAAADRLMGSVKRNSINEFEQALCPGKRAQADQVLHDFNAGFAQVGETLADLSWAVHQQWKTDNAADLDVDVKIVVVDTRSKSRRSRTQLMQMEAVEDHGWYICEIEIG